MVQINMVDISKKGFTRREAMASVKISMSVKTLESIRKNKIPKGDVLAASQVAGILAAKNISGILPLCHQINLSHIKVDFSLSKNSITITSTVKARYATGVEMEALLACAICALNIYDMCKAVDKKMTITDLKLLKKTGGKSGDFIR